MNKKRINFYIKWIIFPSILLVLWIALSVSFIEKYEGLSVVTTNYNITHYHKFTSNELQKGRTISAVFTASDNNMGIVAVRFNTHKRINNDILIFRIKQKGSTAWYYENNYKVNLFQHDKLFTFGFPIIPDSRGIQYVFEIESIKGKKGDAVSLSTREPVFQTKYQVSKKHLFVDVNYTVEFIIHKIESSFTNFNIIMSSLLSLLPFVFYILWTLFFSRFFYNRLYIALLPVISSLIYSLINAEVSYLAIVLIIALSLVMSASYRLEGKVTYLFALFFLVVCPLVSIAKFERIAQNLAVFGYIFLLVGVMQQFFEINNSKLKYVSYKAFLRSLHTPIKSLLSNKIKRIKN